MGDTLKTFELGMRIQIVDGIPMASQAGEYTNGDVGTVVKICEGSGGTVALVNFDRFAPDVRHVVHVAEAVLLTRWETYQAGGRAEVISQMHPDLAVGTVLKVLGDGATITLCARSSDEGAPQFVVTKHRIRPYNATPQEEETVANEKEPALKAGDMIRLTEDVPKSVNVPRQMEAGQYVVVLETASTVFKGRRIEDSDDEDAKHFILRVADKQYEVRQRA